MPTSSAQRPSHFARDVVPEWPRQPQPSVVKNNPLTSERRSIGRRIVRTLARFFIAVLIGVGVTLAWQSHGDKSKDWSGPGSWRWLGCCRLGDEVASRRSGRRNVS